MKKIKKLLSFSKIFTHKIASNEIVKHQLIIIDKNYKRLRFGDFLVLSTLFGFFTLIPIAIVKNLGYITLKTSIQNTRLTAFPLVYEPDLNSNELLRGKLYNNYKNNTENQLAHVLNFYHAPPRSDEASEYDHTYFMNRIKLNTDEKILKILKKSIYDDLKQIESDNLKNVSAEKDEILLKCITSDYSYKKELFSELYSLED